MCRKFFFVLQNANFYFNIFILFVRVSRVMYLLTKIKVVTPTMGLKLGS